jgi:DNA-binding CsgD family transcriptional regulator
MQVTDSSMHAVDYLGSLGFGLFIGWLLLVFSEGIPDSDRISTAAYFQDRLYAILVFVSALLAIRFLPARCIASLHNFGILALNLVLSAVLPLMGALEPLAAMPEAVFTVGWLAFGAALALSLYVWCQYYSVLHRRLSLPVTTLSFLIGAGWFLLALNFPAVTLSLVMLLTQAISLLCFIAFARERGIDSRGLSNAQKDTLVFSPKTTATMVILGVSCGVLVPLAIGHGPLLDNDLVLGIGVLAVCLILGTAMIVTHRRFITFERTLRISFFVIAAFALCLPFMGYWQKAVGVVMLASAYAFIDISNWSVLSFLAFRHNSSSVYHFLKGKSHFAIGMFVGWLLSIAAQGYFVFPPFMRLFEISVAVVVLLLASVSAMPFGKDSLIVITSEDKASKEGHPARIEITDPLRKEICEEMSKDHGLTPREREVLFLLSIGHNATAIARDLTVSSATARSHIYHIYQKLSVSSHQALLDYVEDMAVERCDGARS